MDIDEKLVDWLDAQISGSRASVTDIVKLHPGFTRDDAYSLQAALLRRRQRDGVRLLGYKAAHTSLAIQQERQADVTVGGLLAPQYLEGDQPFVIPPSGNTFFEPEIGVVLGRDLAGPGITFLDAFRAIAGVTPAIEIVHPGGGTRYSRQMGICLSKSDGGFKFGGTLHAPAGVDLRLEGAVVSVNGTPVRSACGVEALGHPVKVVAAIANLLGRHGVALKAGMMLLTGSLTNNIPVNPGDRVAVEFSRIGRVELRFEGDASERNG